MSKFTPGPWKAVKKLNRIGMADFEVQYGEDGECIADVCYEESDASLISAAPDMYEALEAATRYDDAIRSCANNPYKMASFCTAEGEELDTLYDDWVQKSRQALKKANGEETK